MKFRSSSDLLAIDARALNADFSAPKQPVPSKGRVAVIEIMGPLAHHDSWFWQSYDSIVSAVAKAVKNPDVAAVVLRIDSPGGEAAGAVEAGRRIARLGKRKPIYAYSDESAYSAAYTLACGARKIYLPRTGGVGSVGVIGTAMDRTAANEKDGYDIRLLTTGKRKADTHPDRPFSDEILSELQAQVDQLGREFFEFVGKRRGIGAKKVASLEAGIFLGARGVDVGLADGVASWPEFLSMVTEEKTDMTKEQARAALLAKDTTEEERSKALAVLESKCSEAEDDSDEEEAEDGDEDEKDEDAEEDEEKSKSDMGEDEGEDEEAKAGLYTDARLMRLVKQVTGTSSRREAFGALDAMGQRLARADKVEKRLAKLETETRRTKVDSMLAAAKREGRITPGQVSSLREKGMSDPKWLKGYLGSCPKAASFVTEPETKSGGFSGGSSDADKILSTAAMVAGKSPDQFKNEAAKFAVVTGGKY